MIQRATAALRRAFFWPTATRSAQLVDAARTSNRNPIRPSSDFARFESLPQLRARARDAERNNPIAKALVSSLVTNIIGAGIKPQLKGEAANEFTRWTDECDFAGRYDFYGFQQAACRALIIDGEAFIVLRPNPEKRIPLQLQLLGSEYLDTSRIGPRTFEGIDFDDQGRRVAYWLFPKSPALFPMVQSVRVPAEQVIHMFVPPQPGAERGVSWLAPVLLNLNEIRDYMESERVRLKMAALFAGSVHTPDPSGMARSLEESSPLYPLTQQMQSQAIEPGSVVDLKLGEELQWNKPPEAGSNFEGFIRVQLRQIAATHGVPYELLTGDVSQVTFASGRHALLEFRRRLESIQHHIIIFQLCRPILHSWYRFGNLVAGVLPPAPATPPRWIAPLPEMLDAKGEVAAEVARIRAGLKSRSEAVAATGWDVDQIDAEIAADNARADRLGLALDSDPRRLTAQGQAQQQPTQTDETTEGEDEPAGGQDGNPDDEQQDKKEGDKEAA